ncbi:PAAR domain-containing protein, partial [Teichococcus deserti]|uniref:PAAR domain-containing protein n=1 Tax=Teichococcus deserti TaxID=1817963 RepID=UPI001A96BFAC
MPEAARLTDPINHSSAMAGLLAGVVAGVVIAAAAVAIVGTGGVAAVAIGAGIAASGAGGGLAGAYIGELIPGPPSGAIITGAFDVFTGGLPQARATRDISPCAGIAGFHATPLIAQGSPSVFVNGCMAARKGDKLICGASIASGCGTVIIGGAATTAPGMEIADEIPPWLRNTLLGVAVVGTVIATGGAALAVGVGPALGGLGGGLLGGAVMGKVGGAVGGAIGEQFGAPGLGARIG